MENRHRARTLAFKALFSWELNKSSLFTDILDIERSHADSSFTQDFAGVIYDGVINNIDSIDALIVKYLENWDLKRVNKVDLSILRLSIYSLYHFKDIAEAVTINEAINLSKEFGTEYSYKFINGILDSVVIDIGVVLLK